jgi:cytoplasmic iron level regulating protein YaaA (DUF328/UPF0246 family)
VPGLLSEVAGEQPLVLTSRGWIRRRRVSEFPARVGDDLSDLSRNRSTMLIFVPPSETKAFPAEAAPAELGSLALPELAPVRARLLKALVRLARGRAPADRLVVDLRSSAYASLWVPGANAVTVRVLHERESGGMVKRSVVSHFNKATKGRLTRALLESGQQPGKPDEFADLVRALGYTVEPGPTSSGQHAPTALDIVVREL